MTNRIFAKRLVLRKIEDNDLRLITEWSNSKEAHGEYLSPELYSLNECRDKFQNGYYWNDHSKTYLIELKNGKSIGTIHYWKHTDNRESVAYSIKICYPGLRGKNYGEETQKILIKHLFNICNIGIVEIHTDIKNTAEEKCLRKLGFDLISSLIYNDQNVIRTGYLYRLTYDKYKTLFHVYDCFEY